MAGDAQRVERRLAAIFAADVAGYARLINQDEVGTLRKLAAHRQIMDGLMNEHGTGLRTPLVTACLPSSQVLLMRFNALSRFKSASRLRMRAWRRVGVCG